MTVDQLIENNRLDMKQQTATVRKLAKTFINPWNINNFPLTITNVKRLKGLIKVIQCFCRLNS